MSDKTFVKGTGVMIMLLAGNGCEQHPKETVPVAETKESLPAKVSEYVVPMGNAKDVTRFPTQLGSIPIVDQSGKRFDWEGVKGSYTVMITGSSSCDVFMARLPELQRLNATFSPRGVKFYLVYTKEAHPSEKMWTNATCLEERVRRAGEATKNLSNVKIPWLVDSMEGEMQAAMGGGPTADAILNREGKMILRHDWLAPADLSAELEGLLSRNEVGGVEEKQVF